MLLSKNHPKNTVPPFNFQKLCYKKHKFYVFGSVINVFFNFYICVNDNDRFSKR